MNRTLTTTLFLCIGVLSAGVIYQLGVTNQVLFSCLQKIANPSRQEQKCPIAVVQVEVANPPDNGRRPSSSPQPSPSPAQVTVIQEPQHQDVSPSSTPVFTGLILKSLGLSSKQMVVVNTVGKLETQALIVDHDAQSLSINGLDIGISNGNGITLPTASSTQTGLLTSSDYQAFSSAGGVTFSSTYFEKNGTEVTLKDSGATSGSYGSATSIPNLTVDSKGRITTITSQSIPTSSSVQSGLLTGTDWLSFNSKESALTFNTTDGLLRTGNTILNTLITGLSGGQTITGGTASGNSLTLESTSNGTKGFVLLNPTDGNVGIGTVTPARELDVNGVIRGTVQDYGGEVYNVKAYGAVGDGTTDDTTAVQAAITAASNANGGIIYFPSGTYLISTQLSIPNDGASPVAKQKSMRFTGAGASGTAFSDQPNGGSILDLRASTGVAKIDTRGKGTLEIDHLTLKDGGSDSVPFIQTTNTLLHVHHVEFYGTASGTSAAQDAIVLGGTTMTNDNTADSGFGGYGTVIENNTFQQVRRGVYLRTFVNGVVISNNFWAGTTGTNLADGAAIEIDGGGYDDHGNHISGNSIEAINYKYGIKVVRGKNNTISDNSFYDVIPATGFLAYIRFESGASYNTVMGNGSMDTGYTLVSDANGTNTHITAHQNQTVSFPAQNLNLGGDASMSGSLSMRGASGLHKINILDGGTLNIQTSSGGDVGLSTRLWIANNGNIGIGTISPNVKLDVVGANMAIRATNTTGIYFTPNTGGVNNISSSYSSGGSFLPLTFTVNNAERLRISNTGQVSIGTTSNSAMLTLQQTTLGSEVTRFASTATNDDPTEITYQNRTTTSNTTPTTLHVVPITASTTYNIEAYVTARRTGGSSGATDDAAGYKLFGTYKNVGGTATLVGTLEQKANEDQAAWEATFIINTSNVVLQVTGAANNDIVWHATVNVHPVSL